MILLERDKGQIVEDGSIPHIESYEWWQNATMRTLYGFNKYVIEGQENIPDETTPTLITATHRGTGDVPAIGHAFLPQHVRFVSKGCVFKVPIFGQRMREHWNTLEIDKPDKKLLMGCLTTFHYMQDPNLGIFPEATRKKDDIETVEPIPSFVARIAGYSGSLILPMAIWGTHKNRNVLGFSDLFVVAGKPIGPFVFEAGYSIALDGRDVDPKNSSLDTLTPNDRAMIVDIRREITEGMQSCLDKAIKLSEQR